MKQTLRLSISGLGIVFYSPFAVTGIAEGENFLKAHFWTPEAVADHVSCGDITAFCTGTGGDFELLVEDGPLDLAALDTAHFKIRLCLEVRGGRVCFRDLYDLMDWTPGCPDGQCVALADGFYRVTVYTSPPPSGILGDHQRICLHFHEESARPPVKWSGIPQLC